MDASICANPSCLWVLREPRTSAQTCQFRVPLYHRDSSAIPTCVSSVGVSTRKLFDRPYLYSPGSSAICRYTGRSAPSGKDPSFEKRQSLFAQKAKAITEALQELSRSSRGRSWHVLEGCSKPDVYLESDDALVVIEGKRTESGPTIGTEWMPKRHQMLRHLDAAWECRGNRRVYGMFIVEGYGGADAVDVPPHWISASLATFGTAALSDSLPHRGPEEQLEIARCFLGVTTWQAVCKAFSISWSALPDTVGLP